MTDAHVPEGRRQVKVLGVWTTSRREVDQTFGEPFCTRFPKFGLKACIPPVSQAPGCMFGCVLHGRELEAVARELRASSPEQLKLLAC